MANEIICLSSGSSSPAQPRGLIKNATFDDIDLSLDFANLPPAAAPLAKTVSSARDATPVPPQQTKRSKDQFWESDDFDSTVNLSPFSVEPQAKKPRLSASTAQPRDPVVLADPSISRKPPRLETIDFTSPDRPCNLLNATTLRDGSASILASKADVAVAEAYAPMAGKPEGQAKITLNLLSDDEDDWTRDTCSPKPKLPQTTDSLAGQPVRWDPISSSAPDSRTMTKSRPAASYKDTTTTQNNAIIDILDSNSDSDSDVGSHHQPRIGRKTTQHHHHNSLTSDDSDGDELPDLDTESFKRHKMTLSRSRSDTLGLAPTVRKQLSTTSVARRHKPSAPICSPGHSPSKSRFGKPQPSSETRQEKQAAKEAKEAAAAAKAAERIKLQEQRKLDKERKQAEQKAEREKRIALAAINKVNVDKRDTTKEMIVDLPTKGLSNTLVVQVEGLMQEAGATVARWNCASARTTAAVIDLADEVNTDANVDMAAPTAPPEFEGLIRWRRRVRRHYVPEMRRWEPLAVERIETESYILVCLTAQQIVSMIADELDGVQSGSLDAHATRLRRRFPNCEIIYLMEGINVWIRNIKSKRNRSFEARVRQQMDDTSSISAPTTTTTTADTATAKPRRQKKKTGTTAKEQEALLLAKVDEEAIEEAIAALQVNHSPGLKIHHTNVSVETAQWIAVLTMYISHAPYQHQQRHLVSGGLGGSAGDSWLSLPSSTSTSSFMAAITAPGFCIDSGQVRSGHDPADVYARMLEQMTGITKPIAWGVMRQFGSVPQLAKGVERGGSATIADIRRAMGKNGEESDRRIGPVMSRRIWKVFTSRDPECWEV